MQTGGKKNNNSNNNYNNNNNINNKHEQINNIAVANNNTSNSLETNELLTANNNINTTFNNVTNTVITNPKLREFIDFVNTYTKIDKIDDNLLSIVNTTFKTYDKFNKDIPLEAEMYIRDEDLSDFCAKNVNNGSMISLTLDDPRLVEYLKIYREMKTLYIDNCEHLLGVLENKILNKSTVDEKNENPHFTVQNIGYDTLVELETDVRNRLVIMYSSCHEQYQKGMVSLFNGLKQEAQ